MKLTLIAFAALIVLGLVGDGIGKDEADDVEIVLSDMPLKVTLEGEHQANDVYIILVPYCEGTAI